MDAEERARRQTVRRILEGERAVEVAKALGRSERWIFKWLSRYDPADEGSPADRCNVCHVGKTAQERARAR